MIFTRIASLSGFTLSAALTCVALSGCQKDTSMHKITIYGTVRLLDEYGRPEADQSTAQITLISDGAVPPVYTDAQGNYSILVYPGRNTLRFSKEGFGYYSFPPTLIDNSNLQQRVVTLGRVASASVTSIQTSTRNDTLFVSGRMSLPNLPAYPPRQHRLFFFTRNPPPNLGNSRRP